MPTKIDHYCINLCVETKEVIKWALKTMKYIKYLYILSTLIYLFSCSDKTATTPSIDIKNGKFDVLISETGEVRAKKSTVVNAPMVRGLGKIIDIVPEGTKVKKGDYLLQLDPEEAQLKVEAKENELNTLKAELEKSDANHQFQIKQMELSLENAEYRYQLEKMGMNNIEFESKSKQEEKKIQFKITSNNYIENKEKLKLQKIINATERKRLQSKYRKAEMELYNQKKQLENLRLTAPEGGLVVYAKTWKNGRMSKIQIGDTPWSGMSLVELPDLSEIEVDTYVNEVDISRIKVGLKVKVYLDAFKDSEYIGEIVSISRLARRDQDGSGAKVFDIVVKILEIDEKLKPGMSSRCDIMINEYDNVTSIPLEAIFNSDTTSYVYLKKGGSFKKKEITILDKNSTHAAIKEKLKGVVSLDVPE
ncbi:MAG: hypothetical protein CR982_05150 [Candidatus Cloacimonadota bacterium]|nr:MAG: hypothetical protein CR982_05150 [Candidatus Cloacimonadota bacterium]PIE78806.1 MAG: hypothetical protein CSA15_06035 [Candidatus Delongbacteria bacterium]